MAQAKNHFVICCGVARKPPNARARACGSIQLALVPRARRQHWHYRRRRRKIPANRTKFPPMRQTAHTYLTAAEVAALTVACGLQGDVVSVLAYTGLRFGELVGLNVEDVDLDVRRIRV